ncbi:hypothetical protein BC941DRAFT_394594 [Chlamydoabsidia padenii]|nr:hypothetical protein BC941DRAFT_394594 [Chlamydoabsidia padenii]
MSQNPRKRVTRSQTAHIRNSDKPLEALGENNYNQSAENTERKRKRHQSSTPEPDEHDSATLKVIKQDSSSPALEPVRPWEFMADLSFNQNDGTLNQPIYDILDALLELPNVEDMPTQTYPEDQAAALDALKLNEQMQHLVETQINKIDQQIAFNEALVQDTRALSILEARIQRNKLDVHRLYTEYWDFFEETEGTEPFSKEDSQVVLDSERSRSWSKKDRQQLSIGIHSEVQRMVAFEHVSRNEAWRVWEVDKMEKSEWENYPVDKLDWNRISKLYVKTRTPMECMIQWTSQDHPKINKSPWKRSESRRLAALVETLGYHGKWQQIASELNTDRTAAQCFAHYQAEYRGPDPKRPWTKEEDQDLKDAIMLVGDKNWQQVAVSLGDRSGQQCLHRWKAINPAIRRSRWTDEEDMALKASVAVYGIGNWCHIQRNIPGRTDMQCRERWANVLDPTLVQGPFSDEENIKLTRLVEEYGRKWSMIAEHMPGRTDNICLRAWKRLELKATRQQQEQQNQKEQQKETSS